MQKKLIILMSLFISINTKAKFNKINIGIIFNPVINMNLGKSESNFGKVNLFNIAPVIGMNFSTKITNRILISTSIKYLTQKNKFIQTEFQPYLNSGSYIYEAFAFSKYENENLIEYNINAKTKFLIGASFSINVNSGFGTGHHLYGNNPSTIHLGSIDYKFTPNNEVAKYNLIQPLLGLKKESVFYKKRIEFGLLIHIPTKNIQNVDYFQSLTTDDHGIINTNNHFKLSTIILEPFLIYSLNNKIKRKKE